MAFKVGDAFVRLGMDLTEFAAGIEQAQKELERQGAAFERTGETLSKAISAPIIALATVSVTAFAGFEKSMNKVSALGDIVGKDLEKLSLKAKDLGAQTQYSAQQAADAMGEFAAQGFSANEIFEVIGGTLKLAATEGMNLADAAKIAAGIIRGFGLEVSAANDVADLLAKTSSASSTSVQDLGYAFKYIGPVASTAGIGIEDIAAALGVLGNASIRGEQAGTALRKMLLDLANPTDRAKEGLKAINATLTDAQGKLLPFSEVIKQLSPLTKDLGNASKVFGDRVSDILPILRNGGEGFAKMREEVTQFSGAADKMAKTINSGLAGAWEEFMSALEGAAIELGKSLAPVALAIIKFATAVANDLSKAAVWFDKLPEPIKNFAIGVAAAAAAIGPALFIFGQFMGAIGNLKLAPVIFESVGLSIKNFGGMLNDSKGLLGGFMDTVKQVDFKKWGNDILGAFKSIGVAGVGYIKNIPTSIGTAKTAILDFGLVAQQFVVTKASAIGGAFKTIGASIAGFASEIAAGGISGNLSKLSGLFAAFGSQAGAAITTGMAAARAAMISFGASLLPITVSAAAVVAAVTAIAAIGYVVYKNWEDVTNVLVGFWTDMYNLANTLGKAIYNIIETVFGSTVAGYVVKVWDGIVSYYKWLWNTLVDIFSNGLKYIVQAGLAVSKALHLSETEKAFQGWLDKLNGIKKAADDVAGSSGKAAGGAKLLGDAAGMAGGNLKGFKSNVEGAKFGLDNLGAAAEKAGKELQDRIKKAVDGVKDILEDQAGNFQDFEVMFGSKDFTAELKKMEEKLRDLNREWGSNMPKAIQAARGELEKTIEQYRKWGDELENKKFFALFDKVMVDDAEKQMKRFGDSLQDTFKDAQKEAQDFGDLMKRLGKDLGDSWRFKLTGQDALGQAVADARKDLETLEAHRKGTYDRLAAAEAELLRVRRNGEIESVAAAEQRVAKARAEVTEFDRLFNEVMPKAADNLNQAIFSQAVGGLEDLKKAAENLGIDWAEALNIKGIEAGMTAAQKAAKDALEDFNRLSRSGVINTDALRKAWETYLEKKVAADKEANKRMKIESEGFFGFISKQSENSIAEIQLNFIKMQNKIKEVFATGLSDAFQNLFKGDFGGAWDSIKGMAGGLREAMDTVLSPLKGKMQEFFSTLSDQVGEFVSKKITGLLIPALDGIVKHIPLIGDAFNKTFGLAPGVDVAKAAVDAARAASKAGEAAAKTAEALGQAASAASGAAAAATTAASSAGTIAQTGGALSGAAKGMQAATTGLMGTVSAVTGIVTGAITAVTGVLSFLSQRRMEQDIGRIEVSTRGTLSQLIAIQETLNQWLPKMEALPFLMNLNLATQNFADMVVEGLNNVVTALYRIFGDPLETYEAPSAQKPPKGEGEGTGDGEDTKTTQQAAKLARSLGHYSQVIEQQTKATEDWINTSKKLTAKMSDYWPPAPPAGLTPEEIIKWYEDHNNDPWADKREWQPLFLGGTGQFSEDLEYVSKKAGEAGQQTANLATTMASVTDHQSQFATLSDAQLQAQIEALQKAGGSMAELNRQVAYLQSQMSTVKTQAAGPVSGGVVEYGTQRTVAGMPINFNLSVTVNNADANQLGNQLINTWRSRGLAV